jgi:L-histidine Nalpha-methyltransferase
MDRKGPTESVVTPEDLTIEAAPDLHISVPSAITVDVLLGPDDLEAALRGDVRAGLSLDRGRRELPPKWFYDDHGCDLFDEITRLPEYYLTEAERSILRARAAFVAERSGADTIVELGSGTSDKTRTLLDAFSQRGMLRRFVPVEVNEATVRLAASQLAGDYPGLAVHAVVGDFERHLASIPRTGRRCVVFLGSTIGNFRPAERKAFLRDLATNLQSGDSLLLGTDLVKDVGRLEAAYNDRQGITAAFNRNVLAVVNERLGADFALDGFEHVAFFDHDEEWIEMRLRALVDQRVTVAALDLVVDFSAGEELRTEISAKFHRARVEAELASAGLRLDQWMTDPAGDFALTLAFRD